jgi:2-C-methyl-D-erythritol 4-phosphate cytidylyltransferase/2-C-methyl-D-erythritol 2,4-cyclodiphosphate synthase
MRDDVPLSPYDVVIVAAGEGLRAGQSVPKQFASLRGKPLLMHSVEAFTAMGAQRIVVVHPPGAGELTRRTVGLSASIILATGGTTRQESVRCGLAALGDGGCDFVLIHDAARPGVTTAVVGRLLRALDEAPGAIPVLPVIDSLVRGPTGLMEEAVERTNLWRVQTPQAFLSSAVHAAQASWTGEPIAGDDAQVLRAAGGSVALVRGEEGLKKVTFATDFEKSTPPLRVGSGYDVHRLEDGEELWLGGIRIEHPQGLAGHSDADVALHAITDALLGAVGEGDIGSHFQPSDPQWKGAASDQFLRHAAALVAQHGYAVGNVDLTIICEAPRIGPHRDAMRQRIADLLAVDVAAVSVKATTTERLGFTGRSEGIAAQAVATVFK